MPACTTKEIFRSPLIHSSPPVAPKLDIVIAFLIIEITPCPARHAGGYGELLPVFVAPYDHTDHISHMLHSIKVEQELT
jgi:hypothetical protein